MTKRHKSRMGSRHAGKAELLGVHPPSLVEMTEAEYVEAVGLLVTLIDSYVLRHRGERATSEVGDGDPDAARSPSSARRPACESPGPGSECRHRAKGSADPVQPHRDLLADALEVRRTRPDVGDQLEDQLLQLNGQVRRNEKLIERYLLAFEAGTLPEAECGDRVRALTGAISALRVRKEEIATQLREGGAEGEGDCLEGLDFSTFLWQVMAEKADLPALKALLRVLIVEVRVESSDAICPTFRVPPSRSMT